MNNIDEMIATVRDEQVSERQKRERELEERRVGALKRIGEAAAKFLDMSVPENEDILRRRLKEAHSVRISHAEAMASLAEQGDLTGELQWWDIREDGEVSGVSLWKGYVVKVRVVRRRADVQGDYLEVNVRRDVEGGYICELMGNMGTVVGQSADANPSAQRAINRALYAYWKKCGITAPPIPERFVVDDSGSVDSQPVLG